MCLLFVDVLERSVYSDPLPVFKIVLSVFIIQL